MLPHFLLWLLMAISLPFVKHNSNSSEDRRTISGATSSATSTNISSITNTNTSTTSTTAIDMVSLAESTASEATTDMVENGLVVVLSAPHRVPIHHPLANLEDIVLVIACLSMVAIIIFLSLTRLNPTRLFPSHPLPPPRAAEPAIAEPDEQHNEAASLQIQLDSANELLLLSCVQLENEREEAAKTTSRLRNLAGKLGHEKQRIQDDKRTCETDYNKLSSSYDKLQNKFAAMAIRNLRDNASATAKKENKEPSVQSQHQTTNDELTRKVKELDHERLQYAQLLGTFGVQSNRHAREILALENRLSSMETARDAAILEATNLRTTRQSQNELSTGIESTPQFANLQETIDRLQNELLNAKSDHQIELDNVKNAHTNELSRLIDTPLANSQTAPLQEDVSRLQDELLNARSVHQSELLDAKNVHQGELDNATRAYEDKLSKHVDTALVNSQIASLRDEISRQQNELHDTKSARQRELLGVKDVYQGELDNVKNAYEDQLARCVDAALANSQIATLQSELSRLQNELQNANSVHQSELDSAKHAHEEELSRHVYSLDNARIATLQQEVGHLQNELQSMRGVHQSEPDNAKNAYEDELSRHVDRALANSQIATLQEQIVRLQNELQNIKSIHQSEIDSTKNAYESEISRHVDPTLANSQIATLQEKLVRLQNELQNTSTSYTRQRANEQQHLKMLYDRVVEERNNALQQLNDLQYRVSMHVCPPQVAPGELRQQNEDLNKKCAQLYAEICEKEDAIADLEKRVRTLTQNLTQAWKVKSDLLKEVKESDDEHVELNLKHDKLKKELEELKVEHKKLKEKHDDLDEKYDDLDEKYDDLDEKYDNLDEKYDELKEKYFALLNTYQAQLHELTKERTKRSQTGGTSQPAEVENEGMEDIERQMDEAFAMQGKDLSTSQAAGDENEDMGNIERQIAEAFPDWR